MKLRLAAAPLLLLVVACGGEDRPEAPVITVLQQRRVRDELEAEPEVASLGFSQRGHRVRLEVRVRPDTPLLRARELGYDAIRLTKEISPDAPPSIDMGTGCYDYEVLVVTTEDPPRLVVRGTKIRDGSIINW